MAIKTVRSETNNTYFIGYGYFSNSIGGSYLGEGAFQPPTEEMERLVRHLTQ